MNTTKTAWATSKATGGTDTNMLQLGIVILVMVVTGSIQNPLGNFVHKQPNLIQTPMPSVCAPTQQHQKLCQRYTRTTGTPNYTTTVCSLLHQRIRSPSMNKVPRAKSGSKLKNSGTNPHMERLPGQSQTIVYK